MTDFLERGDELGPAQVLHLREPRVGLQAVVARRRPADRVESCRSGDDVVRRMLVPSHPRPATSRHLLMSRHLLIMFCG